MRCLRYIACIVCAAAAWTAPAQTIDELRQEIEQLQRQKENITNLMSANQKNRQVTEGDLKITLAKINNTRQMVTTLDRQIGVLQRDIDISNSSLRKMTAQQDKLKKEYAQMVRSAYKNYKLNNFLVFIFAAEDFNDASRRIDLMRRYNSYREKTANELKQVSDSISIRKRELDGQRSEMELTKGTRAKEMAVLGKEERQHRVAADELKKRQSSLAQQQKEKEKQIATYQQKLEQLVVEETRKARGETLTQEQIEYNAVLTGRFDQNQGKLPFPVKGGVVIEKFGASQAGLKKPAHGIKIAAKPGIQVNSVFEGTVTHVDAQRGMNGVVIVRHGNYLTLYANLASVNVGVGDKVGLNQKIGTIPSGMDADFHYLYFEIVRVEAKGDPPRLNPELWLHH